MHDLDSLLATQPYDPIPDLPSRSELERHLSPEEREIWSAARKVKTMVSADRRARKRAERAGRPVAAKMPADLEYEREQHAAYQRIRHMAIRRLIRAGDARPEVVAYAKRARQKVKARIDALMAGDDAASQAFRLRRRALRRREYEDWAKTIAALPEDRQREYRSKHNEGNKRSQAKSRAVRKAIKQRIESGTADLADQAKWALIQPKLAATRTRRAAARARKKELDVKVAEGSETPDERHEWAILEEKRLRQNAWKRRWLAKRRRGTGEDARSSNPSNLAVDLGQSQSHG